MNEERKMILELLKEGKISVEEAEKLMDTSNDPQINNETPKAKPMNKKFLRIRVDDDSDTKVNINIPIALAEVGLKMVPEDKLNIKGNNINIDAILEMIKEGTEGELVNLDVNENGKQTKVKIFID